MLVSSLGRHFKCIKLPKKKIAFSFLVMNFLFSLLVSLLWCCSCSRCGRGCGLGGHCSRLFSSHFLHLTLLFLFLLWYLLIYLDKLTFCLSVCLGGSSYLSHSLSLSLPPVNQSNQLSDRDSSGSTPFSFYLKNGQVGKRGQIRAKRKKERRNTVVEAMQINLSIYTIFLLPFCLPN